MFRIETITFQLQTGWNPESFRASFPAIHLPLYIPCAVKHHTSCCLIIHVLVCLSVDIVICPAQLEHPYLISLVFTCHTHEPLSSLCDLLSLLSLQPRCSLIQLYFNISSAFSSLSPLSSSRPPTTHSPPLDLQLEHRATYPHTIFTPSISL